MTAQIYDQKRVQDLLKKAFSNQALAGAYLFLGAQGVGKSLMARWFAEYINTHTPNERVNADNQHLFNSEAHPDLIIIKAEGTFIKIKQIKALIEKLNFKPSYAEKRVILIKEADKMNIESANAFLKTLEEPPQNTIIILSCENKNDLPETIVSRCQQINFSLLSQESLRAIYQQLDHLKEDEERIISYSNGTIRKDLILHKAFFLTLQDHLVPLLSRFDEVAIDEILEFIEKTVKKDQLNYLIELSLSWFLDLQLYRFGLIDLIKNKVYIDHIKRWRDKIDDDQLENIIQIIIETEAAIKLFAAKQLAVEALFFKIRALIQNTINHKDI